MPTTLRKPAKERLDYFMKLGILELLPVGSPVKYASRMLVVPKPNTVPNDHSWTVTKFPM